MIGILDTDYSAFAPLSATKYVLVVTFFACYGVCSTILLINLLIAMMGNTYSELQEKAKLAFHYENCRCDRNAGGTCLATCDMTTLLRGRSAVRVSVCT